MPFFSTNNTWFVTVQSIAGPKKYTVQLSRHLGCCQEHYQILVNNQPLQHTLKCNLFSPLCCPGGDFGWDQDGHHFLFMQNCLTTTRTQGVRLFVDGVDVESGLEFSVFWRRRGQEFFSIGLALASIGVILALLFYFNISPGKGKVYFVGISLVVCGFVSALLGLIAIFRKHDFSRHQYGTVILI